MPRGPVIQINFQAGGGNLLAEVKKQTAAIREFGATTKSSSLEANATVRALSGNFQSSTRAVSLFLRETLHLGPALTAAFNVVGPLLFAKVLFDVGAKVTEFFKKVRNESLATSHAMYELSAPLALTTAQLQLQSDQLSNSIARLQGRRQNTLKIQLDEAKVAVIELAAAIEKDLESEFKKLDEITPGIFGRLFNVLRNVQGLDPSVKKAVGGELGTGGYIHEHEQAETQYLLDMQAAARITDIRKRAQAELAAETKKDTTTIGIWSRQQKLAEDSLKGLATSTTNFKIVLQTLGSFLNTKILAGITDISGAKEALQTLADQAIQEQARIRLAATVSGQRRQESALEDNASNAKLDRPLDRALAGTLSQVAALNSEIASGGKGNFAKRMADALAEAAKQAVRANEELKRLHNTVGIGEGGSLALKQLNLAKAGAEYRRDVSDKIGEEVVKLQQEAKAYEEIAKSIGLGYDARIKFEAIAAASKLPGYSEAKPTDRQTVELAEENKLRAAQIPQINEVVHGLQEESALTLKLATAQALGAQAVRRAALNHAEDLVRLKEGAKAQAIIDEMEKKFAAETRLASDTELANLDLKIAANERLIAAKGEQARLDAEIVNKQAAAAKQYGDGSPVVARAGQEAASQERVRLSKEVDSLVNEYSDKLTEIAKKESVIRDEYVQNAATARAINALEQERLKTLSEIALKSRTLSGGVQAFFLDMERDAESAGQIVYTSLHSALDRISDEFGKLFTGQIKSKDIASSFGKTFQGIGEGLVTSSLKSVAQKGLGALGQHIGGPLGDVIGSVAKGKADGQSATTALWVRMAESGIGPRGSDQTPDLNSIMKNVPSVAKALNQIFNSGGSYGGGYASGGDISAGNAYLVGERGPEIFAPRTAGTIIPAGGGVGGTTVFQIDARGAELGVENRISRTIEATSRFNISTSIRGNVERNKRIPRNARG